MKRFVLLSAFASLLLSSGDCGNKKTGNTTYKGRLEIAGICMNYTIGVIEGEIDDDLIAEKWTDESSHISYEDVFRLGNPCDFPATIKQGDEFYFTIDTIKGKECAVCMAFYPTPPKALSIKVVEK